MVIMEKEVPTPSPSLVGQEFVKQYYTLLNKAPEYIHRFYGKLSSYVRGETYRNGEPETPAIGQEEIQRKIVSLGFKDCRTKIRQVDAHSTVGNSVVVQVTGEISNSELPLRRFMQTFVLAPQGDHPCKFYVHNDIFRYQDVVFMDGPYKVDHAEFVQAEEQLETADVIADHDRNNSTGATGYAVENIEQEAASAATAGEQQQQENVQQPAEAAAAVTMTNGVDQHDEEVSQMLENSESSSAASSPATTTVAAVEDVVSEEAVPAVTEPSTTTTTETTSSEPEAPVEEQVETAPAQAPVAASEPQPPTPVKAAAPVQEVEEVVQETPTFTKTFSWADVTKNTNKSSPAPAPVVHHQPAMVKAQPPVAPQPPSEPVEVTSATSTNQRSARAPRPNNRNGQNFNNRDSEDRSGDNNNFNRRPQQGGPNGGGLSTTRYPDNQQIFVGNLTNEINENDLRSHFGGYGNVIDVRINYSHTHNPNFGFVIFEDPKSVEQVLHDLPNQMKSIRINIEEKKQRRGGDRRGNGGAGDYNRRGGGGGGGNMNMRRNNNNNGGGVSMMQRRDNRHNSPRDRAQPRQQQTGSSTGGGGGGYTAGPRR